MDEPQEIQALRQALSFSPDNIPLRKHLASTLIKYGRFEDAANESREALGESPGDAELEIMLARCFIELDKRDEAFVLLEAMEKRGSMSKEAQLMYVRLLSQTTELVKAAELYRDLKEKHPDAVDEDIERELAPFLSDDKEIDGRALVHDPAVAAPAYGERPSIGFDDVGGMDEVKEQVRMKIIFPLANQDLFKAYGKKIGGGILLYGPPGCGKTYLARATAGEVKAKFLSIGLADVLNMFIGQSEQNLHGIFDQARTDAPSVLFFDEVDALGANRSDMRQSGGRHVINQFLLELDGAEQSNEGVLVIGATNAPWHLDPAFRRPGRFDEIIFVPPPDISAREAILRVLLKNKPVKDIDYSALAAKTDGFSGADLKGMVESAIEGKLTEAMKQGALVPVTTKDLVKAAKKTRPSTKDWFATARNHALYANQSGLYDPILEHLKIKKP